jgi:outer membrane biosynthesis protein TonB
MNAKRMRGIAAASLFCAAGVLVCLARPSHIRAESSPAPANPPQETRPTRAQDRDAARNPYKPARALSAADVQFPFQTPADGVVIFKVSLDSGGQVRKTTVLQDVAPFTAAAEQSLRDWKFAGASQDDRAEDSEMLVAFVFRHAVHIAHEPPFTPVFPAKESGEARRAFIPSGILSMAYAGYPANTIAMGAVVVQVNVRPDGSTGNVSVVRDLEGGFAPLAIKAARHWRFQAALREDRPVPGKVAIAFVFSSRALNPF